MLRDAKLLVYLRRLLMYLLMEVLTILTRYATTRPLRVGYIRFHNNHSDLHTQCHRKEQYLLYSRMGRDTLISQQYRADSLRSPSVYSSSVRLVL